MYCLTVREQFRKLMSCNVFIYNIAYLLSFVERSIRHSEMLLIKFDFQRTIKSINYSLPFR